LLHGSSLEDHKLHGKPMGLRVGWLGHITKKHGGCDNVLAGSVEDRGFAHPILDDVKIDVVSPFLSSSAICACHVLLLEGLLK
jgi:hypothetical protein